jgi:hypothetical protein
MDPVTRVRDYLLDNVGHLTFPGKPSFSVTDQRWYVPVCFRMEPGSVVLGDVELDKEGHLVYAPSREELLARLKKHQALPA